MIDPNSSAATLAVRGGESADQAAGAILFPIHQSTTFVQPAIGVDRGHTYGRASNPTVAALEQRLAALEAGGGDAVHASAFANGMAAVTALVLATTGAGDEVLCSRVVYGGTRRLLEEILANFGLRSRFVDLADGDPAAQLGPRTRLVLVETPGNPTLEIVDVAAIAAATRARGIPLAVDNTFLTAVGQDVLGLGADVALYSTTKYVEGHNAALGGAILTRDVELDAKLRRVRKSLGLNQKPFEAWLTLQGLKTLPLRLARHEENARRVAEALAARPEVARVLYPGLPDHPGHAIARRQQRSFGGIVGVDLGSREAAQAFVARLRLFRLAENLGSVESLATHPATMTHADVPPEERAALGLGDGLVRLSVGLEDAHDLVADLVSALTAEVTVR
ncbi:MAG: PLP-dependent aspartate aminotransferase family protein [Planctomycetota bacterium]